MIHISPAQTTSRNLPGLLNEVRQRGDSVLITEDGKPVAALIDIGLLERLCARDEEFAALQAEFRSAFAGMTEAEFGELLNEALEETRASIQTDRPSP